MAELAPVPDKYKSAGIGVVPPELGIIDDFVAVDPLLQPPKVLAKSAIPFIIAPTGTMGNNGAITLGTALPTTYANAYMYLAANAIQAGSTAGWYFVQMSSTTVGTVYQNTYSSGVPSIPASPTAFVSTGPGAYTGATGAIQSVSVPIPANTVGAFGGIRLTQLWSVPNNTDTKAMNARIGTVSNWTSFAATTAAQYGLYHTQTMFNRGAQNSNVSPPTNSAFAVTPAPTVFTSYDFSQVQTLNFYPNMTTATDYIVLEGFIFEVMQ